MMNNLQTYAYAQELRRRSLISYRAQLTARAGRLIDYMKAGGAVDDDVIEEYRLLVLEAGDRIFGVFADELRQAILRTEKENSES